MLYKKNKSEKSLEIKPQLLTLSVDELSEVVGGFSWGADWANEGQCKYCKPENSDGDHG